MRSKLQDLLYDRYPDLYAERDAPMTESAMCWGFAHGDGWFAIIDALSATLAEIAPDIRAQQVKEKFGGLRFYTSGSDAPAMAAIGVADGMSERLCEVTGQPGELGRDGGWYSTLSPAVRAGRNKGKHSVQGHSTRQPATRQPATGPGEGDNACDAAGDDDGMELPALPPLATRLAFSREQAIATLKRRHPKMLAAVKVLDIPPRLFDLVDVTLGRMRGRRHDDPDGPVVRIDEISWSQDEGLVIRPSFPSLRPVALAAIARERRYQEKTGLPFTPPSEQDAIASALDEIMGAARFASELAWRMEVQTGRCGPVDDKGIIIDKWSTTAGEAVDRLANTRQVLELLRAFDPDELTRPALYTRRSVKPTLQARRLLAEKLRDKSWQIIAPKLYAGTSFMSQMGVSSSAYHAAVGLVSQHRWRLMLPAEMSRFLMGRTQRQDLTQIQTFFYDQPHERHYPKLGLTLAPVPDKRALDLNVAGQVIWHHIHQDNPPTDTELRKDAKFAATAWFSNRKLAGWLREEMQAGSLEGHELLLAQAILAAVAEGPAVAEEAPADFDPTAHEAGAARVYDWWLLTGKDGSRYLAALRIENHPHIADGSSLAASTALVWIDMKQGWARTRSRYYRLMGK